MNEDFFAAMCRAIRAGHGRRVTLEAEVWAEFMAERPRVAVAAPAATEAKAAAEPGADGLTLEALARQVQSCRRCRLCEKRQKAVFGEGDPAAELMFIGEGPGADEDRIGRPFVGRAGQLLDNMIAAMKYRREEVYIGNIVKCRPPGNRAPEPDEAAACIGYLKRQVALVRPKAIVILGGVALSFLLKSSAGISRVRGHWQSYEGIPAMPTFHPAYLLRSPDAKRDAWSDLKQVMRLLGKL